MIYSYRHPKHWSNVQPWSPPWSKAPGPLKQFEGSVLAEALKQLPDLIERLKVPSPAVPKIGDLIRASVEKARR